jgi:hypothetical protein
MDKMDKIKGLVAQLGGGKRAKNPEYACFAQGYKIGLYLGHLVHVCSAQSLGRLC